MDQADLISIMVPLEVVVNNDNNKHHRYIYINLMSFWINFINFQCCCSLSEINQCMLKPSGPLSP